MAPGSGGGGYDAGPPPSRRSRSSTGLLIVLGVIVAALAGGIVFVLVSGGDEETADDADPTTTTTDADATTTTTEADETSEQIVDEFATAIADGSNGQFTLEQARCMASGILDVIGLERLAEVRIQSQENPGSNPVDLLTPEEQEAAFDVMRDCVPEGEQQPTSG